MTEHDAYFAQAASDFRVFDFLLSQDRDNVPECHPLHYLQMAMEKLVKAILKKGGSRIGVLDTELRSHGVISDLPHYLRRQDVARALGYSDFRAYRQFLRRALVLCAEIDALHPSVGAPTTGDGPNVEYPWRARDVGGEMIWHAPAHHRFGLVHRLAHSPDGSALLDLVHVLIERFDSVFS